MRLIDKNGYSLTSEGYSLGGQIHALIQDLNTRELKEAEEICRMVFQGNRELVKQEKS